MAMKKCKECGEEISSSAKVCPKCGKKQGGKLKLLLIVIVIIVIAIMASGNGSTNKSSNNTNNRITAGTYLVGTDIESGIYRVILTDTVMEMGYVERANSVDLEVESIIANIVLTGDGYVEIKDTDVAVKLTGVELEKIDLNSLEENIKTEVEDGIYLVGYDIKPGRYKITVTDTTTNMAYIERASAVSMGMEDIIANEIVTGQGYVDIKEGDFAVRVQNAKMTLVD